MLASRPEGQAPCINIGKANAWPQPLFLLHWNMYVYLQNRIAIAISRINVWQRKTLHDESLLVPNFNNISRHNKRKQIAKQEFA